MSKIRLEKDRQLTLPVEIVAQAELQPNDLLEVSYMNDAITLRPIRKAEPAAPSRPIMEYAGICKGVWGNTTEEIEANLAEDRASWDR